MVFKDFLYKLYLIKIDAFFTDTRYIYRVSVKKVPLLIEFLVDTLYKFRICRTFYGEYLISSIIIILWL